MSDALFYREGIFEIPRAQERAMLEAVERIDENRLLNTSTEDLCDYFEDQFKIEVPKIIEEEITVDSGETKIDVSHDFLYGGSRSGERIFIDGTRITFSVPFEGEGSLFTIHPTTYSLNPPRAQIGGNCLQISFVNQNLQQEVVKKQFVEILKEINVNLERLRKDFQSFNGSLRTTAKAAIEKRKQRILSTKNIVASFGYKIKKRGDAIQTYAAPVTRKKPKISMPSPSTRPFAPEPVLEVQEYDNILGVIKNMVSVIERSPESFKAMKEEDLRQHFLVQLNGQYEGKATGETFNLYGKTDILIRENDKNIFIAECKFWRGAKAFVETIDQLLEYVQWRDSKTAILLFNRNKNFSEVLEQIPTSVKSHPNFKRELQYNSESGYRFVLHQKDDKNREIILTVLAFEVPQ